MTNRAFVDELSTDSPAPGGGSVAALCAAQGAALAAMVANLTVGKKSYEAVAGADEGPRRAGAGPQGRLPGRHRRRHRAFNAVMAGLRPAQEGRRQKPQPATWPWPPPRAARRWCPCRFSNGRPRPWRWPPRSPTIGNANSLSDAGVAALTLTGRRRGRVLQRADQPGGPPGPRPERAPGFACRRPERAGRGPSPLRGGRGAARPDAAPAAEPTRGGRQFAGRCPGRVTYA